MERLIGTNDGLQCIYLAPYTQGFHVAQYFLFRIYLTPMLLIEGRCLRSPGAATAITSPRCQNTRLACPTCNQATSPPTPGPPTPDPPQAPVTLEPDSSMKRKEKTGWGGGDRERMLRTAKLLKFNPQCHTNRAMNTLQAHGTTMLELMMNTAGQCQPQGFHSHITAANTME